MYQLAEHNGVLQTIDQREFTASLLQVSSIYTKCTQKYTLTIAKKCMSRN